MNNRISIISEASIGKDWGHYEECPTCKEYDWTGIHRCQPAWDAIAHEYHDEDDPKVIHANDAESAVLKFSENIFADLDYPSEMEIWVRRSQDDEWEKFDVSIETVPSFSATRKKNETH